MTVALGLQAGGALGGALLNSTGHTNAGPLFSQLYGLGGQTLVALPHSRLQESEADEIGLTYMARAGYDPANAVAFWERFRDYNAKQGSTTPWYLRTHPTDEQRINDLKRLLPKAQTQFHPQ